MATVRLRTASLHLQGLLLKTKHDEHTYCENRDKGWQVGGCTLTIDFEINMTMNERILLSWGKMIQCISGQ